MMQSVDTEGHVVNARFVRIRTFGAMPGSV